MYHSQGICHSDWWLKNPRFPHTSSAVSTWAGQEGNTLVFLRNHRTFPPIFLFFQLDAYYENLFQSQSHVANYCVLVINVYGVFVRCCQFLHRTSRTFMRSCICSTSVAVTRYPGWHCRDTKWPDRQNCLPRFVGSWYFPPAPTKALYLYYLQLFT